MDKRQLAGYAYHNCEFRRVLDLVDIVDVEDLWALRIKALCELDDKVEAVRSAELALKYYPESGFIHYLLGMSRYLAGEARPTIEAAFFTAAEYGHPGGSMGLSFLEFAAHKVDQALSLLDMARGTDPELSHVRRLMQFQILAACHRLPEAETHLVEADRILSLNPSLLRQLWGQLCWVRLLRAKGRFDGAAAVLERVRAQLGEVSTPRLYRNAAEAQKMIDLQSDEPNLILPPEGALDTSGAPPEAMSRIRRKPMLHSLYAYLTSRGDRGACKEEIVERVWEESYNPVIHDDRIYKAIGRLRKLLGDDHQAPKVLTQLGRHYVLNLPAGGPESKGDPSC